MRREFDALLLCLRAGFLAVGTLLLAFGALDERPEVFSHRIHGASQIGQLPRDACDVLLSRQRLPILRPNPFGEQCDGRVAMSRSP